VRCWSMPRLTGRRPSPRLSGRHRREL
jgi:hypothetical protein